MQRTEKISEAIKRKYPEQVVLIVTRASDGTTNVMAAGWSAIASGDPLMFTLGIDDESYSYELICATRSFVLAYPSELMAKEVLHAGRVHGRGRDKIAEAGLATLPASKIAAPLLADAVANFECEVAEIIQPGDCPVVFGRVVAAHVNLDKDLRRLYTVGAGHQMGAVRIPPESIVRP